MQEKIDWVIKTTAALIWITFDICIFIAKLLVCIGLVAFYLALAFIIAFAAIWVMELKVKH